jgi:glycosyltransferase involved in cell wall biosynthesis
MTDRTLNAGATSRACKIVVFFDGEPSRLLATVRDLESYGRPLVLAGPDPRSLDGLALHGAEILGAATVADAVNTVWGRDGGHILLAVDAVLTPTDIADRAEAILAADLRYATVSFFSNDAGPSSFPNNHPIPMTVPGFDHVSLTERLRTADPELTPCPTPYAAGGIVALSAVALGGAGGFETPPEGVSPDAVIADFSMRCRSRGFVDLLDPQTYVTRLLTPGRPMHRPMLEDTDRQWLHRRHPQLVEAFEREPALEETALQTTTHVAQVKAQGLRVLVDDATLGPIETGAQVTTLAIIDILAKQADVAEVGVALGHHIPAYARAVLGQPKIRPGLRVGHDYGGLTGYDVLHRTAQPDRDFDVGAARAAARRVVVSVLDLIAYRAGSYHATADDWLAYRSVLRRAIRQADGVTTISQDVAAVLELEQLPIGRDRVFPVLYGTEHLSGREPVEFPAELATHGRLAGDYVVCLGTDYAHKNRDLAIAVHAELRRRGHEITLILAGPSVPYGGSRMSERQLVDGNPDVLFLPSVSSRERNWLFRHAAAVLYPTSAEGFGLVPFEAARFDAPTVTVGFGPLLETVNDVPVIAPSWDPVAFADCVERLLRDPGLRREQVKATLAAADRYSWQRTAGEFLRMYRTLLALPAR